MTSNRRIGFVITLALATLAVTGIAAHKWYHSTLPPLTNAELARAIERRRGNRRLHGGLARTRHMPHAAQAGAVRCNPRVL